MPHYVEDEFGKTHIFPDEATPEMMESALKENRVSRAKEVTGSLSPLDILKAGAMGLGKGGERLASTFTGGRAPKVMEDIGKMVGYNPGIAESMVETGTRYAPALAAGGASILGQMLSMAPYAAVQYQPGEQNLFGVLPEGRTGAAVEGALSAIMPLAAKGVYKGVKAPINLVRDRFKSLSPQKEVLAKEAQNLAEIEAEEQVAKLAAQTETGKSGLGALQHARQEAEQTIEGIPEIKPSTLPIPSVNASQQTLEDATRIHQQMTGRVQEAESDIGEYLFKGAKHDEESAKRLLNQGEQVRQSISNGYNQVTARLKNQNVVIDNKQEFKSLNDQLMDIIKSGEAHTPEAQQIAARLNEIESGRTIIPADEYLTLLRSAKDEAYKARQKAFKPDMNAEERAMWKKRYNELDDTIEKMEDNFVNNVNPEDALELKNLNFGWKEYVKPMQRSSTYQTIKHRGRIEGDIIKKLRGTDKADVLMRDFIRRDPELARYVLGQKHAKNPSALLDADEAVREYVASVPELNNRLISLKEAQQSVSHATESLSNAQTRHAVNVKQENTAFKAAEKEQKAISDNEIKKTNLEDDIAKYNKAIDDLTRIAKSKNVSLERKVKAEKELREMKDKRKSADKKLKLLVGIPLSAAGLYKTKSMIGSLLSDQ